MRHLSGHTQPFAVLGHPIGHTLSPVMHNAAMRALDMDAVYLALDVAPDRLMEVLPAMAAMGFRGVNLTVPLKEVAFRGLRDLADSARLVGAVNTVEFTPQGLRGHNTDGDGFLLALQEDFGAGVESRSVFVLGCGGAGRALALVCATRGARHIVLADTDTARPAQVAREIATLGLGTEVEITAPAPEVWEGACRKSGLVIHSTPVGMKPGEPSLLSPAAFHEGQLAFDLIYMFPETPFMAAARAGGARTANGLGMLLHQGAKAFGIWTGRQPPVDVMRQALQAEVYKQR